MFGVSVAFTSWTRFLALCLFWFSPTILCGVLVFFCQLLILILLLLILTALSILHLLALMAVLSRGLVVVPQICAGNIYCRLLFYIKDHGIIPWPNQVATPTNTKTPEHHHCWNTTKNTTEITPWEHHQDTITTNETPTENIAAETPPEDHHQTITTGIDHLRNNKSSTKTSADATNYASTQLSAVLCPFNPHLPILPYLFILVLHNILLLSLQFVIKIICWAIQSFNLQISTALGPWEGVVGLGLCAAWICLVRDYHTSVSWPIHRKKDKW